MIDTHCHIDDEIYVHDLQAVVERQRMAGVEAILVPGINIQSIESVMHICKAFPQYLYPALGLHPEEVNNDWRDNLLQIREAINRIGCYPKALEGLIAIGEIGLDYYWSKEYSEEQKEAFLEQLRWAVELNLPVMVHSRNASEDTLQLIRKVSQEAELSGKTLRGVMHCFSGSREIADAYIQMGWYLGIGGVITFKNCKLDQTLCPSDGERKPIPLSQLLLETDAPYMTPVPYRGKPNESRFLQYVVHKLSLTYGISENEVIELTNRASRSLFGIK